MDPFFGQLKELCGGHPIRAKWVVVPTHAVGHSLGERLAREGTSWLNLRFVTPLDLALRMGAPFLVERGVDPSEEGLGPALMMRLLMDLPEDGGYFRPLAHHPTLAEALWTTVRELRLAGVAAADLPQEAFRSAEKHREMRALLASYERFLATSRRGDMATVYEEALGHHEWCPVQAGDCWIELPDVVWAPLQRRLLDTLPGERIPPRAFALPAVTLPRRIAGGTAHRLPPEPEANPLALLMSPNARPVDSIDLFRAGGRDAEIEEVWRRILATGGALDDVEIVCASDAYPPLVWEKALRHEWPVTLGPGVQAVQTRPGRALLAFCGWIESDFAAGFLRRLLQSGDVRLDVEDLTAGQAARLLFRAQAGWGRHTYSLSLQRMLTRHLRQALDMDAAEEDRAAARQKVERIERLRAWLEQLIASVPEPGVDRRVNLQPVVDAALAFLDGCAARASALDVAAAAALRDAVGELRALDDVRAPLLVALRFIRERVEGIAVAADRPRAGHLYISRLADAAHAGRRHLFVLGLEEGRVFPAAVEDPILLDAERAAISPSLRLSGDRIDEAVYAALARLASHSLAPDADVCFSYSSRDTREYRETFASWLMLQAFRLRSGRPSASYPDLRTVLGVPRSAVPASATAAASDTGWWLAHLAIAGESGEGDVLHAFPWLRDGRLAEAARSSASFTVYDGLAPEAGTLLDPCVQAHAVSPTQLEAAAECPFRHFLRFGLGLRAVEEDERDRDVWLDPLTRGAELHDLYAAFLRRCRAEQRRPDLTTDCAWLLDVARARLETLGREMPPSSDEVRARETEAFLADLELFAAEECSHASGREPVGFEVSFGRELDDERVEGLASDAPIEVPLGRGLLLRLAGRIDRIDRVAPDAFEIVDYKTGGYFENDWRGTFAGGTRLQHALYAVAAVELLKQKYGRGAVTGAVYYFSSARGRQERVRIPTPSPAALQAVLGDLREVIRAGAFVHAPSEDACKWCDFGRACGGAVHDRAAGKLGDPILATYLRLRAHV